MSTIAEQKEEVKNRALLYKAEIKHFPPLNEGERVEVNWGEKFGWLPATFQGYTSAEYGEDFKRCLVKMDNGYACDAPGYHPECVRRTA